MTKRFFAYYDGVRASVGGAFNSTMCFEPSNLLRELLQTCRAFDRPKFIVLVHGIAPGAENGWTVPPYPVAGL